MRIAISYILLGSFMWTSLSMAGSSQHQLMPDAVKVIETDEQGPLFVNAAGFTLYTYPGDDQPNVSNCNDKQYHQVLGQGQNPAFLPDPETRPTCEQAWPPHRAESDASPVGDWSIFQRHDGARQWSYRGKPVYTSMYDKNPGDMTSNRGFLARTPLFAPPDVPSSMSARVTRSGYVLTGSDGMTLYSGVGDTDPCKDTCGSEWRPFQAPAMMRLDDTDTQWSIEVQADGSRQWARNGKLLYTYDKDREPGELQGRAEQGWTPVILSPSLTPPDDITIQVTTEGEVFADRNGMTIYIWNCIDESPDRLPCDTPDAPQVYRTSICGVGETCINTWRPVVASPGSEPVGTTWTVIPVDPTGAHQYAPVDSDVTPLMVWAYQGKPVYTYAGDEQPGDLWGHKIRSFVLWGYSMIKRDLTDY